MDYQRKRSHQFQLVTKPLDSTAEDWIAHFGTSEDFGFEFLQLIAIFMPFEFKEVAHAQAIKYLTIA